MSQPVTIENEHLKLDVWPQLGGKVSSIVDKRDGFELLFTYPAEIPTRCQYGMHYRDGWYGGWDECFPAIIPGAYPLHPYEGIAIPDHGELWPLPTTAVPTRDGITTVWHGLRFGYRLTRKLFLDGPTINAEYTLVNLAPFEFRFVWALHALLSMQAPATIEIDPMPLTNGHTWPSLDGKTRGDSIDTLPDGASWKIETTRTIDQPAIVRYPTRKRSLVIDYASDDGVSAYWGIWLNTGGWEGQRHFAIEPMTGRHSILHRAIEDDSAGRVPPTGRVSWRATLNVAEQP